MRFALLALFVLAPQEKPDWAAIVRRGQENLERLRELRSALPRAEFEPAELAKSLGGDPAKAAEFVRTRIAGEPYRGFMKGAQGALVSRRAGWADRALLLAALVAERSPRLVRGTLAPVKQPAFAVARPAPAADGAAEVAAVAARLKVDAARLEKKAASSAEAARAFLEAAWTRIDRDLQAVSSALEAASVEVPGPAGPPSEEVWWVRIGAEDLGKPEGAVETSIHDPAELPAGDVHRLAVRMKIRPPALIVEKRPARFNARLYRFALARAAAQRELAARLGLPAPATSGTALVSFVSRVIDGRPPAVLAGFDILANPAANSARADSWKGCGAFGAGIVDTALEREVHRAKGAHENTSVLLERAIAAGTPVKVERMADRVRVTVPGAPASWYEVDPRTGECLGYVEGGGGQDMAEYATLLVDKLEEVREWQSHAELLNSILECAMNAIDAADSEASFAHCVAGVAIGEAFGWAAGGIIGGAAEAMGSPWARLGGMALEDWMGDAFGAAMDAATGGR